MNTVKERLRAEELVKTMVEEFGVSSYLDNEDDGSIWFTCPCCDEPILLLEDYSVEEAARRCPVCEEEYEG